MANEEKNYKTYGDFEKALKLGGNKKNKYIASRMIIADWLNDQLMNMYPGKAVKWHIPYHLAMSHMRMVDMPIDTAHDVLNGKISQPRTLMGAAIPADQLLDFWASLSYWVVPERQMFPFEVRKRDAKTSYLPVDEKSSRPGSKPYNLEARQISPFARPATPEKKAVGTVPEAVPEAGRAVEVPTSDAIEPVNVEADDVVMADANDQTVETTVLESVHDKQEGDTASTSTETSKDQTLDESKGGS